MKKKIVEFIDRNEIKIQRTGVLIVGSVALVYFSAGWYMLGNDPKYSDAFIFAASIGWLMVFKQNLKLLIRMKEEKKRISQAQFFLDQRKEQIKHMETVLGAKHIGNPNCN